MKRRINTKLPNRHHIVIASSGGGKSTWLKTQCPDLAKAKRVLLFDPDDEYDADRYRDPVAYFQAVTKAGSGPIRAALSVDPTVEAFEWWAGLVRGVASCTRPTVALAEEIANVTTIAKAPPNWGWLARTGRKYGLSVIGVTQRPAECDKTIFSQAGVKWIGAMDNEADQKKCASIARAPLELVKQLRMPEAAAEDDAHYLMRDSRGLWAGRLGMDKLTRIDTA